MSSADSNEVSGTDSGSGISDLNSIGEALASVDSASTPAGSTGVLGPNGKLIPGQTLPHAPTFERNSAPEHTWSIGDHSLFNVRVGPDYYRNSQKAPSGVPMYEPFAADVYCSKQAVDNVAARVELPDTSHINTHHECISPILVIQTQFPAEPPSSIFSMADDGPCNTLVMYFRITKATCDELKDLSTASAAVKLFHKWAEKSQGKDMAGLKMIGDITNLESFGLPSWLNSWNCKPVLIKPNKSCTITRDSNYMAIDVNVSILTNIILALLF